MNGRRTAGPTRKEEGVITSGSRIGVCSLRGEHATPSFLPSCKASCMQGLFCSIHITYIYASIISLMSDHPSAAGDCLVIAANQ